MAFVVGTRSVGGVVAQYDSEGPAEAFAAALAVEPEEETYVSWTGTEELCALDFDAEPGYLFDDVTLLTLLEAFLPQPFMAWTTRSGGLRLMYSTCNGFRADEVAAVAALNLSNRPHRGVELKRDTRHPGGPDATGRRGGAVYKRQQNFDASSLRRYLGVYEATDLEVGAWLDRGNYVVGSRYDHDKCPVSPSGRGGRQPVFIGERGVHCFVCEADGVCAGSSRPGFFPYSFFCGRRRASHLYRCLENATHWEHARFVLDHAVDLPPQHARLIYSAGIALLRSRDDAHRAFAVGENLVRIGDRWTNLCAESYVKDVKPLLSQLPVCTYTNGDGKTKLDRGRVVLFEQAFDLARYGYPSLVPVFGCRMWPRDEDGPVTAVVQTRELSDDSVTAYRPQYVAASNRMSLDDAWTEFDRCFPGMCHELLLLLVAARGIAEGGSSMPPMVFVTGPTGASKSVTPFLAASVCGDRNTEVVWASNNDRLRQAVGDAAAAGCYVTFNEVLKEARREMRNGSGPMDYVLNLTPDSVSWVAYIGPVRLGRLPVLVWTDTELPAELRTDAQLARRVVHVHLSKQLDWEPVWKREGLRHAKFFRTSSDRRAEACNAVLSHVMDRFLRPPMEFSAVAEILGFGRVSESDEAGERTDALLALFDAVCGAQVVDGADAVRWKGRGWKRLDRDIETPLREAWAVVADEAFTTSRAASEVDWQKVAKLREAARVETRVHGHRMAVRFRSIGGTRSDYRVNEELR